MDEYLEELVQKLVKFSLEVMCELKCISWEGIENWDELFDIWVVISGELVFFDFICNVIVVFKNK